MNSNLLENLDNILSRYQRSFSGKVYADESDEHDWLMDVFSLTPETKRENRQYWGRELGMCWQLLVTRVCEQTCTNFQPALRIGKDEPCDLIVGEYAIDTKYRIGSGDSGTLKKFRDYGSSLIERGYSPILLILRSDNLPAAIQACQRGGWTVLTGQDSLDFIKQITGFDMENFLVQNDGRYSIGRDLL